MIGRRRVFALVLVVATLVSSLSGCNKADEEQDPLMNLTKEELVDLYRSMEESALYYQAENEELQNKITGVLGSDVERPIISEFGDGSGRLTLNSEDGTVRLPVAFEFPYSTQIKNDSGIKIGENVTIRPSSNWIIKIKGTESIVEHVSAGISCTFRIGNISNKSSEEVRVADLEGHITKFFESMPPDTIKFNRIYIGDNWRGTDAQCGTFVDEQEARIRCGMITYGEVCVTYMISYKGEKDDYKDELILNLLQTMRFGSNDLRVE